MNKKEAQAMLEQFPHAGETLAVMFNEDGDAWNGSSDFRAIVKTVAPMYSREWLSEFNCELGALLSGRYSEIELQAFVDRVGVRMGIGQLTVSDWLTAIRNYIREYLGESQ
jgi:hypothetical protein